jgi:hypothetical protein
VGAYSVGNLIQQAVVWFKSAFSSLYFLFMSKTYKGITIICSTKHHSSIYIDLLPLLGGILLTRCKLNKLLHSALKLHVYRSSCDNILLVNVINKWRTQAESYSIHGENLPNFLCIEYKTPINFTALDLVSIYMNRIVTSLFWQGSLFTSCEAGFGCTKVALSAESYFSTVVKCLKSYNIMDACGPHNS